MSTPNCTQSDCATPVTLPVPISVGTCKVLWTVDNLELSEKEILAAAFAGLPPAKQFKVSIKVPSGGKVTHNLIADFSGAANLHLRMNDGPGDYVIEPIVDCCVVEPCTGVVRVIECKSAIPAVLVRAVETLKCCWNFYAQQVSSNVAIDACGTVATVSSNNTYACSPNTLTSTVRLSGFPSNEAITYTVTKLATNAVTNLTAQSSATGEVVLSFTDSAPAAGKNEYKFTGTHRCPFAPITKAVWFARQYFTPASTTVGAAGGTWNIADAEPNSNLLVRQYQNGVVTGFVASATTNNLGNFTVALGTPTVANIGTYVWKLESGQNTVMCDTSITVASATVVPPVGAVTAECVTWTQNGVVGNPNSVNLVISPTTVGESYRVQYFNPPTNAWVTITTHVATQAGGASIGFNFGLNYQHRVVKGTGAGTELSKCGGGSGVWTSPASTTTGSPPVTPTDTIRWGFLDFSPVRACSQQIFIQNQVINICGAGGQISGFAPFANVSFWNGSVLQASATGTFEQAFIEKTNPFAGYLQYNGKTYNFNWIP